VSVSNFKNGEKFFIFEAGGKPCRQNEQALDRVTPKRKKQSHYAVQGAMALP
jgi:hypothetical protein